MGSSCGRLAMLTNLPQFPMLPSHSRFPYTLLALPLAPPSSKGDSFPSAVCN